MLALAWTEGWTTFLATVAGAVVGGAASTLGAYLLGKHERRVARLLRLHDEVLPALMFMSIGVQEAMQANIAAVAGMLGRPHEEADLVGVVFRSRLLLNREGRRLAAELREAYGKWLLDKTDEHRAKYRVALGRVTDHVESAIG